MWFLQLLDNPLEIQNRKPDRLPNFQQVAEKYKDISIKEFKKASRLIKSNDSIFSGPDSAKKCFTYFKMKGSLWHDGIQNIIGSFL